MELNHSTYHLQHSRANKVNGVLSDEAYGTLARRLVPRPAFDLCLTV